MRIPVISGYSITSVVGAKTDASIVSIDLRPIASAPEQGCPLDMFLVSMKTVGNATAPGASRTVTPNIYWSGEELADASTAPTVLADRKIALTAKTLPNSASATRQWECSSPSLLRAPFLYVSLDHTTVDANCEILVDVSINRIP